MPNKIVDTETRRRIGDVLAPEIPSVREGLAAMQNATVAQILRTWIAGRPLTPYTTEVLVDVLQSRGYLQGEATPEILVTDNVPGHMNLITEELTLPAEDPTSSPKPITLGAFVQLTPHVPPASSDRITLEIAATWKTRIGSPDPNDNPTIRSTEIASTVTVLKDHYCTLLTEPEGTSDSEARTNDFHLLLFRANLFEPDRILPQTAPASEPPAPSPPQAAMVQPGAAETDRQVLLSFAIAEIPSRQILDRETAILVRALLAAEAGEDYTAPRLVQLRQPLWRVFREHLADPNLSGDTVKAVLDVLISNGYGQILSTPKVLTTNR
jgi:hypothetical protein